MKHHPKITITFNILLILYSTAYGIFVFALSDTAKKLPLEGLIMTSLVDFVRFLLMMFITAWFVKEVWNRLLADIFKVRLLAYREAITIVVALGLFMS